MNVHHFKLALTQAEKSISKFRLGAVLVKKNQVISTGFNIMNKTHPMMQKYNTDKSYTPGLHAEIHSCLGVPMADLYGADLYVVRILKNGKLAVAKPCQICKKFILDVGIKRVYFSNTTGQMEEM